MKDTVSKKFVIEFKDENTKAVVARWHYDYSITKNGPILTEDFSEPPQEVQSKKQKKVVKD